MTEPSTVLDLDNLSFHPMMESIVDELCDSTQDYNRGFYRTIVAYFFSKVAASMRAVVTSPAIGEVPVNCYAFALAPSGFGKNTAISKLERRTINGFKKRLLTETMPMVVDQSLYEMAIDRALVSGKSEEDEKERLSKMYAAAGPYPFTAKKATASAIEQLRNKLLMSGIGSINIQIDEIGMNITDKFVMEGLNLFLELYDMGHTDQAVTKNTTDNARVDDIDGMTPACLLAFGTPGKLFDGSQSEAAFHSLMDTGYARRAIFGWGERRDEDDDLSAEEIYDRMVAKQSSKTVSNLMKHFSSLADSYKLGFEMEMPRETGLYYMAYKIKNKERSKAIPPHEDIKAIEMEHRHWKALKLAGALAFVDESLEVTPDHLLSAIAVVEESGLALSKVLNPEKSHVKMAKFIAHSTEPVTHADLYESLPFYKTSGSARQELHTLAAAWGYKNNIVIRKLFEDGIEFFEGETLTETSISDMIFSYSNDIATGYVSEESAVPFEMMPRLLTAPGLHWCNHSFEDGHRRNDKAIPGFNMVVVDVDGGVSLDFIHEEFKDFTFLTQTTKRHTEEEHRFRLIMPISHILNLTTEDYREFMNNLFLWLPFESDKAANQRNKKWLTEPNAEIHLNHGNLLSPLPFIPKTSKNAEYQAGIKELGSLDNLERWFAQHFVDGDRNNQMIRFALTLLDTNMALYDIEQRVLHFNASLANGLSEDEIRNTVMRTVARKFSERSA